MANFEIKSTQFFISRKGVCPMSKFDLIKLTARVLTVVAVALLFVDWKIAMGVFLLAAIARVFPLGPDPLLALITGVLIIGGIIFFFFDWRISIGLLVAGFLVAKFRIWSNKRNFEYYQKGKEND